MDKEGARNQQRGYISTLYIYTVTWETVWQRVLNLELGHGSSVLDPDSARIAPILILPGR